MLQAKNLFISFHEQYKEAKVGERLSIETFRERDWDSGLCGIYTKGLAGRFSLVTYDGKMFNLGKHQHDEYRVSRAGLFIRREETFFRVEHDGVEVFWGKRPSNGGWKAGPDGLYVVHDQVCTQITSKGKSENFAVGVGARA